MPQPAASPESLQMQDRGSYWASLPWNSLLKTKTQSDNKTTEAVSAADMLGMNICRGTCAPLPVAFLGPRIGKMERHRATKRCGKMGSEARESRAESTNVGGDMSRPKRRAQKCNKRKQEGNNKRITCIILLEDNQCFCISSDTFECGGNHVCACHVWGGELEAAAARRDDEEHDERRGAETSRQKAQSSGAFYETVF